MSLLVDKSDRMLTVTDGDQIIAKYPIVIGKNPNGHKRRQGDMRTPEGTYRLAKRTDCGTCRFRRALVLNYPNRQDRREGRTGGGILIHRAFFGQMWTQGCIGVRDFDDLFKRVPDGAVVVIRP